MSSSRVIVIDVGDEITSSSRAMVVDVGDAIMSSSRVIVIDVGDEIMSSSCAMVVDVGDESSVLVYPRCCARDSNVALTGAIAHRPKSQSLTDVTTHSAAFMVLSGCCTCTSIFSGFTSRCTTPCSWQCASASARLKITFCDAIVFNPGLSSMRS